MDFNLPEIDTSAAETGVEVALKRIDGEPLLNAKKEPVTLTLIGADSKLYRKIVRKHARARVERTKKLKGEPQEDDTLIEEIEAEDLELIVACTLGWSGILDSKNAPVKFSKKAAEAFYTQMPIAKEQADRAIVDRAHFIKASSAK